MHLFILYNTDNLDLDSALGQVSEQRREQILAFKPLGSRKRSAAAYLLLCHALKVCYGLEEKPVFIYGGSGKPSIEGHPEIHFNLSHCSEAVVCAIDDHAVGVDVESVKRYRESVARYVCSDNEMDMIFKAEDPASAFIALWTKKEATLKLTGEGIHDKMKDAIREDVYYSTIAVPEHSCICTVASFNPIDNVSIEVVDSLI